MFWRKINAIKAILDIDIARVCVTQRNSQQDSKRSFGPKDERRSSEYNRNGLGEWTYVISGAVAEIRPFLAVLQVPGAISQTLLGHIAWVEMGKKH